MLDRTTGNPLVRLGVVLVAAWALLAPAIAHAQSNDDGWSHVLSIGDSRRVKGLRLNFRDRRMEQVDGINLTLWTPHRDAVGGVVNGLALGLPVTGADQIQGLAVGAFGIGTEEDLSGIGIGGLGIGGGGDMRGLMVGGLGAGAGGDIRGVMLGGLGAGSGGDLTGIILGGIGVGAGGSGKGLLAGAVGAGVGGDMTGIGLGGVGLGVGGDAKGLLVGGIGAGTGGDFTGVGIGGVGLGVGGTGRGLWIGGLGVGGSDIRGLAVGGLVVGGQHVSGLTVAGLVTRIEPEGSQGGVAVSAFNQIKGQQRGLTIGVLNYAAVLDGVQVGAINIAKSNRGGRKVLPIANWPMR